MNNKIIKKKHSRPLAVRVMQIKATMRCHLTPVRIIIHQVLKIINTSEDV
jgi:hypothetical protein